MRFNNGIFEEVLAGFGPHVCPAGTDEDEEKWHIQKVLCISATLAAA